MRNNSPLLRIGAVFTTVVAITLAAAPAQGTARVDPEANDPETLIKCSVLDGEQFCTVLGFIDIEHGSAAWKKYIAEALSAPDSDTGDMSLSSQLAELSAMPAEKLAVRQQQQLTDARAAVGKVKLYDYLGGDSEIPDNFFREYPSLKIEEHSAEATSLRGEAQSDGSSHQIVASTNASASYSTIPASSYIMYGHDTEQETWYWCGPAAMQMLDWGDPADDGLDPQSLWASLLGTTHNGTGISAIVSQINSSTTWDSKAGTYSVVSVANNTQYWFRSVHRAQLGLYKAPVLEHVRLRKAYFNYLNYDHGGHFQVGRGYYNSGDNISIMDPYDERDFRSGGAASGGLHSLPVAKLWNATKANSLKNIGI